MKKTITPGFRILFVALLSLCGITATSQVVINEYSCSNFESFPDNYDSFEDWIELYNPGASAINIGGYFLSDKPDAPMTWQIPAGTTIPANGFKLFWASGRMNRISDRFTQILS
ncbi:MAG: lamin tail domain-containing protein [Bacteroidales bacterium]|nr:lamin tail domain-containing protein [Bacteroidales bacterium]